MIMKSKTTQNSQILPKIALDKRNLFIFAAGILVISIGFFFIGFAPWDNPISLSVAPIILLIGYFIIFPWAIFSRKRD
jgi:hypothetical protein